jgi:outer membrane protein OmpA-like peptidoglycan-associated protein
MRNLLIGVLLSLWLLLGWMYSKDGKTCCGGNATALSDSLKIFEPTVSFEWDKASPNFSVGWQAKKDSLISLIDSTHILEIAGYRCDGENEEIGIQRARLIREAFTKIPDQLITTKSIDGSCRDEHKNLPFEGVDFSIRLKTKEIIEQEGRILIYFPENSANRINSSEIESYLITLAERLKSGNERITITGHTDDSGDASNNLKLGQKRADVIKIFLVSKGVNESSIIATSAGESIPLQDNNTAEGKAANRRTEISF